MLKIKDCLEIWYFTFYFQFGSVCQPKWDDRSSSLRLRFLYLINVLFFWLIIVHNKSI
jgi:hypothetical protein